MSRPVALALAALSAGVLAGPAAGQTSVWYNPEPGVAMTTKTMDDGERLSLFVRCNASGLLEPGFHTTNGDRDPSDRVAVAFRFDGDPETETVAMFDRMAAPPSGGVAMVVSWPDAYALLVSLRSADYAEAGAPGGGWGRWTLRGAKAAIDRLPCTGGGA